MKFIFKNNFIPLLTYPKMNPDAPEFVLLKPMSRIIVSSAPPSPVPEADALMDNVEYSDHIQTMTLETLDAFLQEHFDIVDGEIHDIVVVQMNLNKFIYEYEELEDLIKCKLTEWEEEIRTTGRDVSYTIECYGDSNDFNMLLHVFGTKHE